MALQFGPGVIGHFTGDVKDIPKGATRLDDGSGEYLAVEDAQRHFDSGQLDGLRPALREAMAGYIQQSQISDLRQKYHNINSLQDHDKIQAVKDTSLNPFLFDDPHDGLANSLSRWSQEAPAFAGKSDIEKVQIASKYYDEALVPLYQKLGATPLSRDIWLRNAWKSGLSYDPSQAYRGALAKGALEGIDSAVSLTMNALRTVTNVAGLPVVAYEDSVKSGDFTGLTGFYNLAINMHNRVKQDGLITGLAKSIEETGERNPTGGSKWMHDVSVQQSFWSNVTPARSFTEKATSFVVENAMLLPFFGAVGKGTELGIGLVSKAAEGVPMIKNLTEVLGASKLGQTAAKMMTYGTEGLIFHDLTAETDDKKDAWKTALQFAAMGTLFSLGGKGASKLVDMLPEGVEKDTMSAAEKEAQLGIQGLRSATPEEYLTQYRKHVASVMAAGGIPLQHSILEEALAHVYMEEKAPMELMDRLKFRQDQMDVDPARWKTVFANMGVIRNFLDQQGWKITDMNDAKWSDLRGFLDSQIQRAGEEMDLHVPQVQAMKGSELLQDYLKTPQGQEAWKVELSKQQETFRNAPDGEKKAEAVAKSELLKRQVVAVKKAAEDHTETGPENVERRQSEHLSGQGHPETIKAAMAKMFPSTGKDYVPKPGSAGEFLAREKSLSLDPKTAAQRVESRYEYDKSGKVTGYQMGISFNWRVAKNNAAEALGGKNTSRFWQKYVQELVGNTDDDVSAAKALAEDLKKYFNPLKDYGLQFEKANTAGGDYTNFLAFMYSYKDKLPDAVSHKLEEVLMNSPKMSELLGSRPTIEKIEEFGQAIQNHVDIFTRSDWYKKFGQSNVFRSSQPGIKGIDSLSKWQRDLKLIESAHKNDLNRASEFYPGKSKVALAAQERYKTSLQFYQKQEITAYVAGKPKTVSRLMAKSRALLEAAGGR